MTPTPDAPAKPGLYVFYPDRGIASVAFWDGSMWLPFGYPNEKDIIGYRALPDEDET